MPEPTTASIIAVVLSRIEALSGDVKDLTSEVKTNNQATIEFREKYYSAHEQSLSIARRAHERLDAHDTRITALQNDCESLTKAISPMIFANKIVMFIGSALMLSIIGLIVAIITHQVTLGF